MKSYDAIDELADRVNEVVAKINNLVGKARHRVIVEHDDGLDGDPMDDGDGYEDVSNPSMEADNSDNDGDNESDDGDNSDDDEEEDDAGVTKASINAVLRENSEADRPGRLKSSDHGRTRHKFEALTDKIKNDHGIPKSQAMAYARQQYPDVYRSYQNHVSSSSTSYAKRGPTTAQDLIAAEIRKGFSPELAGQRVAQLHGFRAFDTVTPRFAKGVNLEYTFLKRAEEIMDVDQVDATEALRRARLEDPRLFRAFQRSGRHF
jgi:hypothetical protein